MAQQGHNHALTRISLAGIARAGVVKKRMARCTHKNGVALAHIGSQHFTDYVYGDGASRSYCYPILAADGTSLTRDFPMKKDTGEDTDHPWHRLERGEISMQAAAEQIKAAVAHADLQIVAYAGHAPFLSAPDVVAALLQAFFDEAGTAV